MNLRRSPFNVWRYAFPLVLSLGWVGVAVAQVAPSGPPPDGTPATSELRPGSNSFTVAQARDRLEYSGYSDVTGLTKDDSGIWRAQAIYGGAPVSVGLDYRGAILRTQP